MILYEKYLWISMCMCGGMEMVRLETVFLRGSSIDRALLLATHVKMSSYTLAIHMCNEVCMPGIT